MVYYTTASISVYFETFSASTAETLFLLVISILAMESAHSIRFLFPRFLFGITEKSQPARISAIPALRNALNMV